MKYKITLAYLLVLTQISICAGSFNDIQNYKYKSAIDYLRNNNIVQGYNDGSFQPNKNINRAEFLKIILESNKFAINTIKFRNCFPDVGTEWYAKYVCFAKEMGIIQGYNDGTFKPDRDINYVEALKIAYESNDDKGKAETKEKFWYSKYLEDAQDRQISLNELSTDSIITRGEMSELMYRLMTKKWNLKKGTTDIQLNTFTKKAILKITKGKVYIKNNEKEKDFKEANNNMELNIGNIIKTDENTTASIYWPDDSITRLNNNTTITITNIFVDNIDITDTKIEVDLLDGELWTKSLNLINGKSKIEIKYGDVIAGVRGSSFNIKKENDTITASAVEHILYIKTKNEEKNIFESDEAIIDIKSPQSKVIIRPINITEKDNIWWTFNKENDKKFITDLKSDFNNRFQELNQDELLKNYYIDTSELDKLNNEEKEIKKRQLETIGKFLLKYKDINILEQNNLSQKKVKDNLIKIIDDPELKKSMIYTLDKQIFLNNFDDIKDMLKDNVIDNNNFINDVKTQFYKEPDNFNLLNNFLQSDIMLNDTEIFKKIKQRINEMEEKIKQLENQIKTLQK